MNTLVSFLILVIGIVLLTYGINASNSLASGFSRLFSGSPTDKSLWLVIGGALVVLIGVGGLLRGSRSL